MTTIHELDVVGMEGFKEAFLALQLVPGRNEFHVTVHSPEDHTLTMFYQPVVIYEPMANIDGAEVTSTTQRLDK